MPLFMKLDTYNYIQNTTLKHKETTFIPIIYIIFQTHFFSYQLRSSLNEKSEIDHL